MPAAAEPVPTADAADAPAATDPKPAAPKRKRPEKSSEPRAPKPVRKPRGPPRPHRKLEQDTLTNRIDKLQKRIDRSKAQLEDAERHIEGYNKEAKYRTADSAAEKPADPTRAEKKE